MAKSPASHRWYGRQRAHTRQEIHDMNVIDWQLRSRLGGIVPYKAASTRKHNKNVCRPYMGNMPVNPPPNTICGT